MKSIIILAKEELEGNSLWIITESHYALFRVQ
jgi:hypothetical protein